MRPSLTTAGQDQRLAVAFQEQRARLSAFVRRRVADAADAEEIVQEVFYELVVAYRLLQPVEQLAGWLLRVARNRIIDRFRARSREAAVIDRGPSAEPGRVLEEWVPTEGGPDAEYARELLGEALEAAVAELPRDQREVFIAHELEGRSFKELAAATGINLNTLLGRKHAAVRYLRERLRSLHDELTEG